MNYSTSETVIGKWIDGKPLYRLILTYTTSSRSEWTYKNNITPLTNLDRAVSLYGIIKNGDLDYESIPFCKPNNTFFRMYINKSTFCFYTTSLNKPITIIIEYTKTTD